jgi:hypothetical protein
MVYIKAIWASCLDPPPCICLLGVLMFQDSIKGEFFFLIFIYFHEMEGVLVCTHHLWTTHHMDSWAIRGPQAKFRSQKNF